MTCGVKLKLAAGLCLDMAVGSGNTGILSLCTSIIISLSELGYGERLDKIPAYYLEIRPKIP